MKETGLVLKEIGGVILVQTSDESRLYCIDDLQYVNELTIGQLFNAVRILNSKSIEDYGDLWPTFRVQSGERKGEISEKFKTISSVLKNRKNDLERLKLVFAQLQEEFPELYEREKAQERLELFNEMIARIENQ